MPNSTPPNAIATQSPPPFHQALIESSVATLQHYEPHDAPYWGCFSGGKDSVVIKALAAAAGIDVEWHYNVTTIDPPEVVTFIRRQHPDVIFQKPIEAFHKAILRKGIPTRRVRWCCELFKEKRTPPGRRIILGVRAAESPRRARTWSTFTRHRHNQEYAVLPILHWEASNVWQFIHDNHLEYCCLYDQGFKRIGCVGCPLSGSKRIAQSFARWPAIARQIKRAARTRWEQQKAKQIDTPSYRNFADFDAFWTWWLSPDPMPTTPEPCTGQAALWS